MRDCQEYRVLLSGMMDGELSAEESHTINQHLNRCEACRQEYERLREDLSRLDAVSIQEPDEAELQAFWRLPYSGLVRNAGLVLVIGGYVGLMLYGLIEFFRDGEWWFGKVAGAAIAIGCITLLGIVIIERVISYKSDPYKEVNR
jgi:predicted anti-sigma-YlaC factor YlaD